MTPLSKSLLHLLEKRAKTNRRAKDRRTGNNGAETAEDRRISSRRKATRRKKT